MGLFERLPYTNFHELNATWIIEQIVELKTTIEQFVSINALKYADPIQWNITTQYEKNTIVIDPLTGTAYISVQPVPSGVNITNTDYWTVVFDLGSFVVRAAKNFTDKWEDETTLTATFPSSVNDWIIWGDVLYVVKAPIIAGDQYVIGSNIEHFTAEDVIGHIQDLNTTDKSNLVAAINELITIIGDLDDLNTSDKDSIVNAINEVLAAASGAEATALYHKIYFYDTVADMIADDIPDGAMAITKGFYAISDGGGAEYNISDTGTADGMKVLALNNGNFATLIYQGEINVLKVGIKNDGSEDASTIVNAISAENLYFPEGTYRVENTLNIAAHMRGSYINGLEYLSTGQYTRFEDYTGTYCIESSGHQNTLSNFMIHMNGDGSGIYDSGSGYSRFIGITIENLQTGSGIVIHHGNSRAACIDKCTVNGDKLATHDNIGINFELGTDCNIIDTALMNVQNGIKMANCLCQMTNVHIWNGAVTASDNSWWNNTAAIALSGNSYVIADGIYADCSYVVFAGGGSGNIMVNNLTMIGDDSAMGGQTPQYDDGHIFASTILSGYSISINNAHYFGSQTYWKDLFRATFGRPLMKNFYINHGSPTYSGANKNNVICCDHNDVHGFSRDLWNGQNDYKEILRIKKITAFSGISTCMVETSTNDVFRLFINANNGNCEAELISGTLPSLYVDSSEAGYYVIYMNDGASTTWCNVTLETQPLNTVVDYWHNTYNNQPIAQLVTSDVSGMTAVTTRTRVIAKTDVNLTVSAAVDSVYGKYYIILPAVSGYHPVSAVCIYQYPELIVENIYYDGTNYIATLQGLCAGWSTSVDIIYAG